MVLESVAEKCAANTRPPSITELPEKG
jgi:hypothetical protein